MCISHLKMRINATPHALKLGRGLDVANRCSIAQCKDVHFAIENAYKCNPTGAQAGPRLGCCKPLSVVQFEDVHFALENASRPGCCNPCQSFVQNEDVHFALENAYKCNPTNAQAGPRLGCCKPLSVSSIQLFNSRMCTSHLKMRINATPHALSLGCGLDVANPCQSVV